MGNKRKIVFLSGTRADYGKLKPLIKAANEHPDLDVHVFVTGMHMLEKYGGTAREVLQEIWNVYLYNNQAFGSKMDIVLSNTIYGFSHYISEIKPDLIILDVMMPDMSGLEVCEQLRVNPATARLPIIMLSARGQVNDKVSGFKVGADDYVPKPVEPAELLARAQALLQRTVFEPHRPPSARP